MYDNNILKKQLVEYFSGYNLYDDNSVFNEDGSINERSLTVELLDVERFIKMNNLKEVSNPVFFNGVNPTSDGLLSNEIFGITKAERSGIYAYIELGDWFLAPIAYKVLCKLNSKIEAIVNGIKNYSVVKGEIVEDENGGTGLTWLKKNLDQINFDNGSKSIARKHNIEFIKKYKDHIWIKRFIIIPPYYRDVDTKSSGSIGVGEINKLYSSILISSKALKETSQYGLNISDANKGRIQTLLKQIFDWFGAGTTIGGVETGGNLPGKTGIIKKGVMYKTIDYSVRLVMSAADLNVEDPEDVMTDMDYSAEPLEAVIVNFQPYIVFYCRRFFEKEFAGLTTILIQSSDPDRKSIEVPVEDYQIMFSDVEIIKQINRFVHGYSNRFIPIPLPVNREEYAKICKQNNMKPKQNLSILFKGHSIKKEDLDNKLTKEYSSYPLISRPLTWCDLFYMAAVDAVKDKMVLITRFPIDRYLNQFPSKVHVRSTIETENVEVNGIKYRWYPKIRKEDIGTNTSPLFYPTLSISNGLINAMGLDFDGDTSIVKPIYTIEANKELEEAANSKVNMIGLDGISARDVSKECIMCIYSLTIQPDDTIKFIDPVF